MNFNENEKFDFIWLLVMFRLVISNYPWSIINKLIIQIYVINGELLKAPEHEYIFSKYSWNLIKKTLF